MIRSPSNAVATSFAIGVFGMFLTSGTPLFAVDDSDPAELDSGIVWRSAEPTPASPAISVAGTVVLPDAELVSNGQQLSGMVVDPDGKLVADVQVSARLASGRMLARPLRGPPPWSKTDSDGRFTLGNLPDEPVQLMAYRAQPGGGRIRYPAYALPPLNARDIRIVLDPRLGSGIEDLDAE